MFLELFKFEISLPWLTRELLLQMVKTSLLFTCNMKVAEKIFRGAFVYSTRDIQLTVDDDDDGGGASSSSSGGSITSWKT